jgi:predicted RNase H-like nuclease
VLFIGLDAAWGDINETGLVAVEPSGVVRDAGWAVGVVATAAWVSERAERDTLVLVDAPLIVANPSGQRLCEKQVAQRYGRWRVSANSTNTASRRLGGVALLAALAGLGFRYDDGLDGPPVSGRAASECYPYTTIVGYEPFGYDERPRYKRKPRTLRIAEFRPQRAHACDDLIRRVAALSSADPPLDLSSHPVTRALLDEPSPLADRAYKHREDLLDAALCAWTASLWHRHGLEHCQVLGAAPDVERPAATIIAPARPEQREQPPPRAGRARSRAASAPLFGS